MDYWESFPRISKVAVLGWGQMDLTKCHFDFERDKG